MSISDKLNSLKSLLDPLKSAFTDENKAKVVKYAPFVAAVVGIALAIFGVVHFVPHWGAAFRQTHTFSYMTFHQLKLNSFAFASLIIGPAMVLIPAAKLVSDKIKDRKKEKSEPDNPFTMRRSVKYLTIAGLAIATSVILLLVGGHALNTLNSGALKLTSGIKVMAVSQAKLHAIYGYCLSGAALGSLGVYASARFMRIHFAMIKQHSGAKQE